MKNMHVLGCAAVPLAVLASCGPIVEPIEFRSEVERECYITAESELDENEKLLRDAQGIFVIAETDDNGFLRRTRPSDTFENCMVRAQGGSALAANEMRTINLTKEEEMIWNSLSDQAKEDALVFMQEGGSLKDFVAP